MAPGPTHGGELRHLCAEGPVAALTGPVERGGWGLPSPATWPAPAGLARALYRPALVALVTLARKSTLTGTISL